ncbi:MAG: acyl carrier protein [Desulfobacterales bacterium]|nr:acyl carrier protein [Desulfobacterales bacterium]
MSIFEKIVEGIFELFPSADEIEINDDTVLEEIPDWDSMASVNFMMFLQQAFDIQLPNDFLHGELKISEIVTQVGG